MSDPGQAEVVDDPVALMEAIRAEQAEIAAHTRGMARTNAERNLHAFKMASETLARDPDLPRRLAAEYARGQMTMGTVRQKLGSGDIYGRCQHCGTSNRLTVAVATNYDHTSDLVSFVIRSVCSEECWDECLARMGMTRTSGIETGKVRL